MKVVLILNFAILAIASVSGASIGDGCPGSRCPQLPQSCFGLGCVQTPQCQGIGCLFPPQPNPCQEIGCYPPPPNPCPGIGCPYPQPPSPPSGCQICNQGGFPGYCCNQYNPFGGGYYGLGQG